MSIILLSDYLLEILTLTEFPSVIYGTEANRVISFIDIATTSAVQARNVRAVWVDF